MEIDIFPIPSKKGVHYYIGTALLGIVIITFIIGAYKVALHLIGEEKEFLCLLVAIVLFVGGYTTLIFLFHFIKVCLYAYFKHNRKELNNIANQEDLDTYIITHLEEIQKKLEQVKTPPLSQYDSLHSNILGQDMSLFQNINLDNELQPKMMPEFRQALENSQLNLTPFIKQLQIDRIQLTEAKAKQDKEKLENILRYTRLVFLPHGFKDEEIYQIEEAVKLLVQCNGIVNCVSVQIEKNKLKQADLKNFAWNIGYQYNIDSELLAMFVLNLFHAWFKNTEKETIRKTLRNTTGNYSIDIDENIFKHLPILEEKALGQSKKKE